MVGGVGVVGGVSALLEILCNILSRIWQESGKNPARIRQDLARFLNVSYIPCKILARIL